MNKLNEKFADYAESHEGFWINDYNYIASCYGIDKWADPFYWQLYIRSIRVVRSVVGFLQSRLIQPCFAQP